jgi:hypothetical protein
MIIFLNLEMSSIFFWKNLRKTSDGLRMLSAMCTLLNQYGKDNFKPIMKESFNNITHTNNSVTEKLFVA